MTETVAWISPGTPIYRVAYKSPSGLRCSRYTPATSEDEAIANVKRDVDWHTSFEAMKTECVTK